jgi:folate-binding protein YgfZ
MKLSSFPVLELRGPDAAAFAHAQFSSDVAALADGRWQWSAWLTPQGRVRAFFALLRLDAQHLQLILRGGDAAALRDALRRYVLRAKVSIEVAGDAAVGVDALPSDCEPPSGDGIARRGEAAVIAMPGAHRWLIVGVSDAVAAADWTLADIRDGIPFVAPALLGEALPHWLGLIRLGAVSVKKGCYPGQEITSRLHFKGGNKRSLYRVTFNPHVSAEPGTPVVAENGERAGQIVMASNGEALAILAHASADQPLRLDAPATALQVHERFD